MTETPLERVIEILSAAGRFAGQRDERGLHVLKDRSADLLTTTERGCQCAACALLEIKHTSDCSVHNEPALPIGSCDCELAEGSE
jgi:hypothetical protein